MNMMMREEEEITSSSYLPGIFRSKRNRTFVSSLKKRSSDSVGNDEIVQFRLNATEKKNQETLREARMTIIDLETKYKERLADQYSERFRPILRMYELISSSGNKFRKPLYQVLIAKCPKRKISAARLAGVLIDTYVFDDPRRIDRLTKDVVAIFRGTPFTTVETPYSSNRFEDPATRSADFREICCALRIFQFPVEDSIRRLHSMFDIFDTNRRGRLCRLDVSKLFHVPVVSTIEHREMARRVEEAFGPIDDGTKMISRPMFGTIVRVNVTLVDFFHTLCDARMPLTMRLDLKRERMKESQRRAEFLRRKLQWRSVRSFYERNCSDDNVRRTWDRWRGFVAERRLLQRAERQRRRRSKRSGLEGLKRFVRWKSHHRLLTRTARAHHRLTSKRWYLFMWHCAHEMTRARSIEFMRKAKEFHRTRTLQRFTRSWHYITLNEKALRFRRRMQILIAMLAWKTYCEMMRTHREEEERRARERIIQLEKDVERGREEAESILMEKEEDRMRELMRREELEILQKQRDEEYRMQLDHAKHRAHQKALWRRQVENRLANKKAKKKQDKKDFRDTWSTLAERSMQSTKDDTMSWIETTKEGRTTIQIAAKKIYKIWKECIEEFETPSMALWQGVFDPVYGTLFFFNKETKEKIGEQDFTMAQSKMVAIDHYLARQMERNVEIVKATRKRERRAALELKSAKYIQDMWRSRKSRKIMREIVRRLFEIRYDVDSAEPYYYHVAKRTKQQRKPRMLGNEKLEQPDYARVKAIGGGYVFHNTKKPWLSTPEKPAGYLLCSECNFFLARRYCKNCKEHFCIDCYWNFHKKGKRREHEWDKFHVKQQHCDMCHEKIACVLCHACGGSMYCEKCSAMVHRTKPNRGHAMHDF